MAGNYTKLAGKFAVSAARREYYNRRLDLVQDALRDNNLFRGSLLDIGSADGDYANDLFERGYNIICIDKNRVRLKDGRLNYTELNFICSNACYLPFRDGYFDAIVSLNVLRYIPEPLQAISECRRVLKNGGLLILSDHNKMCPDTFFLPKRKEEQYLDIKDVSQTLIQSGFNIIHKEYLFVPPPQTPVSLLGFSPIFGSLLSNLGLGKLFPEMFFVASKNH